MNSHLALRKVQYFMIIAKKFINIKEFLYFIFFKYIMLYV